MYRVSLFNLVGEKKGEKKGIYKKKFDVRKTVL